MIAPVATLARLGCSSPGCAGLGTHRGPGGLREYDDEGGLYLVVEGPPLCEPCSRRVWRVHRAEVEARLELIHWSAVVGYALRRSQVAAVRERVERERDGVQLTMWEQG